MYKVYVMVDADNYITAINSDAFMDGTDGWIEIDSGDSDKYHHAQGNYFPMSIMTDGGAYRYKLVDGKVVECTAEEITKQEKANKPEEVPTRLDILEAQLAYTAMMTDTLLEV